MPLRTKYGRHEIRYAVNGFARCPAAKTIRRSAKEKCTTSNSDYNISDAFFAAMLMLVIVILSSDAADRAARRLYRCHLAAPDEPTSPAVVVVVVVRMSYCISSVCSCDSSPPWSN
jgi:hypothetical protein